MRNVLDAQTFTPVVRERLQASKLGLQAAYLATVRRAAEILLVASMYNSTTPTAPIWSEITSQAQRRTAKSLQTQRLKGEAEPSPRQPKAGFVACWPPETSF